MVFNVPSFLESMIIYKHNFLSYEIYYMHVLDMLDAKLEVFVPVNT